MSEQWDCYDDTVALIRNRRNTSIGKAQAILKAWYDLGEIRSEIVLVTPDDALLDFNLRPGALNKGAMTMDGRRLTSELTRLRFSRDDLLYLLDQQEAPRPAKRSRKQVERDRAKQAIKKLYRKLPDIRKLPTKKLHPEVNKHLQTKGEPTVSYDTVRRAAQELRAAATKRS